MKKKLSARTFLLINILALQIFFVRFSSSASVSFLSSQNQNEQSSFFAEENTSFYQKIKRTKNYEIPLCDFHGKEADTHQIVEHTGYALCYREKHEVAEWVSYTLDKTKLQKAAKRANNFRSDPLVKTGSASTDDYKRSGYDRGHLAPAADMAYSELAMSESFFMSNMTPQRHRFNAGVWKNLEDFVRTLGAKHERLFVATGPILEKDGYPTIGENNVAVPEFFYKVILIQDKKEFKMLAFLIPGEEHTSNFWDYQCSVDEVESRTNIDFFWLLDDKTENRLEAEILLYENSNGIVD